jgi:hypothetical protein
MGSAAGDAARPARIFICAHDAALKPGSIGWPVLDHDLVCVVLVCFGRIKSDGDLATVNSFQDGGEEYLHAH